MKYYVNENEQNRILEHLYDNNLEDFDALDLLSELHSHYSDYDFYPERYKEPFKRKLDFFKPLLKGKSFMELDFSKIETKKYSKMIFNEIMTALRARNLFDYNVQCEEDFVERYPDEVDQRKRKYNDLFFLTGEELADYLEKNISEKEILENRLEKDHRVGLKRHGAGGTITRLLSALTEIYNLHYIKENYVGNLVKKDEEQQKIYLSTHPITGYIAGMIADSCLNPNGCNSHAGIIYNGYKNAAMFHNESLTWRAFVSFDFEKKYFRVSKGYPREDYLTQFLIKEYFTNLGYTFVDGYFRYPGYWDDSSLFKGVRADGENYDATCSTTDKESITGIGDGYKIASVFHSDYHDTYSFDPNHQEMDDYVWADYEQDDIHYDEASWSDLMDSYFSEYGESKFYDKNGADIYEYFIEAFLEHFDEDIEDELREIYIENYHLTLDVLYEHCDYTGDVVRHTLSSFVDKEKESERFEKLVKEIRDGFYDVACNKRYY